MNWALWFLNLAEIKRNINVLHLHWTVESTIQFHISNKIGLFSCYITALVLAGTELIFLTVASTLLCSGFMMKTVLVTHQCFSSCWAVLIWSQSLFLLLMLPCQQGGWECTRWEGTQAGQLISTDWRIRPYDIMISNKRPGGKFAGAAIAQGLAGHQSDGGEKFCFSSVSSLPHLHQPTIY